MDTNTNKNTNSNKDTRTNTNTNKNTNTNLKHEVECPGHDDGVVEGDHGGDAEEAVPHPSKAGDKAGEDLRGRLIKLSPNEIQIVPNETYKPLLQMCLCIGRGHSP